MGNLTAAHLILIDTLAEAAVRDYLTAQAAQQADSGTERTEPVPLPRLDQAA